MSSEQARDVLVADHPDMPVIDRRVWAEGKGHSEIVLSTIGLGVGFCKRCEPLVDLPADREVMPLREGTCATHGEYNNFSGRCLACIPAGDLLKRGDA